MPFKYIGLRTNNFGLPLWEIVLNLKNFGKGRIVHRTKYTTRYPKEPTYYKILNVEPHSIQYPPGEMKGNIWVEVTFRGKTYDEPLNLTNSAYQDDFILVPKHEETDFTSRGEKRLEPEVTVPRTGELPPIWKEILRRQNPNMETIPQMNMVYTEGRFKLLKVAKEGEKADFELTHDVSLSNGQESQCPLYNDVIFNREEAKKIYNEQHEARKMKPTLL